MGDVTIANATIEAVEIALLTVGEPVQMQFVSLSDIDENDPGAEPTETVVSINVEGFVFNFDETYMPGTNVIEGDSMGLISLADLTDQQVADIGISDRIVVGTAIYEIVKSRPIDIAGKPVTYIFQLKST